MVTMTCLFRLSVIAGVTAIGVVAGSSVWAQSAVGPKVDPSCAVRPNDPSNCAPLVACLGGTGIYFIGKAIGWNSGSFAGQTNAGFLCSGSWKARNFAGFGEAHIECDNGLTGGAIFAYRENVTGTAVGRGLMSDGRIVQMWSGHEIRQFVINAQGDVDARLMCGSVEIPIS